MRRRGAEEAKVVIQKQSKEKNYHHLSSCPVAEKKKNSLSLSVVLLPSSSPYCVLLCSLCKGEQQHKEMRREEMTFSAKL